MKLEGLHHITCITGDAPRNVDFYARVMGMRLSKKTVNQDDPTIYHLFYTDEQASPGFDLTFFEFPGAAPGRAGAGMVHTIVHRVGSAGALDFWAQRLGDEGIATERDGDVLRFADPEGLGQELAVVQTADAPLIPQAVEVPDEFALQGFDSVRSYSPDVAASERLVGEALEFESVGDHDWEARGEQRGGRIKFDESRERGRPGAGTVHHVAWATHDDEQLQWRERAQQGGAHPTPVIDRFYFKSIYFREPGGVLYEIATHSPGFTADEEQEHLGEKLSLPPDYERLRSQLDGKLTPLPDTQPWRRAGAAAS